MTTGSAARKSLEVAVSAKIVTSKLSSLAGAFWAEDVILTNDRVARQGEGWCLRAALVRRGQGRGAGVRTTKPWESAVVLGKWADRF